MTECVQTYWLCRCAELALEKHYDGFRVLSDVRFVRSDATDSIVMAAYTPPVRLAAHGVVYTPIVTPSRSNFPQISADIQLIEQPLTHAPHKVFDAVLIQRSMEPYLRGEHCKGNVCPNVHRYVQLDPPQ